MCDQPWMLGFSWGCSKSLCGPCWEALIRGPQCQTPQGKGHHRHCWHSEQNPHLSCNHTLMCLALFLASPHAKPNNTMVWMLWHCLMVPMSGDAWYWGTTELVWMASPFIITNNKQCAESPFVSLYSIKGGGGLAITLLGTHWSPRAKLADVCM